MKLRIRKDAATFGAKGMPTDVRSMGTFLGVRNLEEVNRHLCENNDCCYAWIVAVCRNQFDANECCPKCGTTRYLRVGHKLEPRRKL